MTDQIVIIILTVLVVVANLANAIRCFYTAAKIDVKCRWACLMGSRYRGIYILTALGVLSSILVILKSWAIHSVFLELWYQMNHSYQLRSYAFLAENLGVALIGWKVTDFIRSHAVCNDGNDKNKPHCDHFDEG